MVIVGAIFSANGKDVLVLVSLFIFVVLSWVWCSWFYFLSRPWLLIQSSQTAPNVITEVNKLGLVSLAKYFEVD